MSRLFLVSCLVWSMLLTGCVSSTQTARSEQGGTPGLSITDAQGVEQPAKKPSWWEEHPVIAGVCIGLGVGVVVGVVGFVVLVYLAIRSIH